jgi:hypothetical protein
MLKFAECARRHGVLNFPDPPYQDGELNKDGFAKGTPQMEKADRDCHALALASEFVESKAEIDYYLRQDLKISECMRAHGVANFPDPSSTGNGGPWPSLKTYLTGTSSRSTDPPLYGTYAIFLMAVCM